MLQICSKEQYFDFETHCARTEKALREEFIRLYSDYQEEYLFHFLFEYYWQYQLNHIEARILLHKGRGTEEITPIKVRHIWPNRNYFTACLRKGRKLGEGVLLPFSTLEELQNIKSIEAFWAIEGFDVRQKEFLKIVHVKYDLTFEQAEKGKFFSFHSREIPFKELKEQDSERAHYFPSQESYRAGKKLFVNDDHIATDDSYLFGWVDISESQLTKELSAVHHLFGKTIEKHQRIFMYESFFDRSIIRDTDIYGLHIL